jgi:hypothetical protein
MRDVRGWFWSACCAGALLGPGVARADVAPDPEFGQSLSTANTATTVAMTHEIVTITLGLKEATVEAVFTLHNTGPKIAHEIGFPDVVSPAEWSSETGVKRWGTEKLRDFKAWVGGTPQTVGRKTIKRWFPRASIKGLQTQLAKLEKQSATAKGEAAKELRWRIQSVKYRIRDLKDGAEDDTGYMGWYVWPMTFAADQAVKVKVSYRLNYEGTYGPTLLDERRLGYVLLTGAEWHGAIGHAEIHVRWAEGMQDHNLLRVRPAPTTRTAEGFSWDLKELEPTEDIHIELKRWPNYAAAGAARFALAEKARAAKELETVQYHQLMGARAYEKGAHWTRALEAWRRVQALERSARATKPRQEQVAFAYLWKEAYIPTECAIARCLQGLGKADELKAAAAAAAKACTALTTPGDPTPAPSEHAIYHDRLYKLRDKWAAVAAGK